VRQSQNAMCNKTLEVTYSLIRQARKVEGEAKVRQSQNAMCNKTLLTKHSLIRQVRKVGKD
jgi:hypothetical protein